VEECQYLGSTLTADTYTVVQKKEEISNVRESLATGGYRIDIQHLSRLVKTLVWSVMLQY
jgi:hypothetical protein